jgi:hypothetical protein
LEAARTDDVGEYPEGDPMIAAPARDETLPSGSKWACRRRAHNAAIRRVRTPDTQAVPSDGRLRVVSNSVNDEFVRTLRDELDRALNYQRPADTDVRTEKHSNTPRADAFSQTTQHPL